MLATGTVIDPSSANTPDGQSAPFNMGRANELLVAELHGKYFEQCYRGNIYYASTATAGVVIPIASTLTPTYSLWNPAGSGKLLVPIVTLIAWRTTAAAQGALVWTATTAAGDAISTTAPFVAFGTGTPLNARLGLGKNSSMRIATGGTTTLIAAPSFFRDTGINAIVTGTGLNSVNQPLFVARDDWDGAAIVPPGNAIHLMGDTAIAITAGVTTAYAEIPL